MVATRFRFRFRPPGYLVCLGLIGLQLITLGGCKKAEEIRTYTVPHRERPKLVVMRMLGAIIPNAREAWFFKLQGPDDAISGLEPQFVDFTKSVTIKNGKVTWKAPETWTERAGGEFRVTTFLIPHGEDKPYELAVSRLDAPEGVNDQYLVMNLSRWRGQLGRDPITAADIPAITTKVDFQGGSAWVVNFTGLPSQSGSMGAPFANAPFAGHPPVAGDATEQAARPREAQPADPQAQPLEYEIPKGWEQGKQSSMRKASFKATDGEAIADVSVFQFGAEQNNLLSNVNRWRGSIGLKETNADDVAKSVTKIDVSGHQGDYVELVGEKETILGVMVKKGDSAWFFKLQAPTALAGREKARFEEFVKSSRLP